uniref:Methyltransferase-like 26 n=1 Tax=Panagrolaimus sp. PS1159 TaxID=55785 RepID=A0AC35FS26_9BILA
MLIASAAERNKGEILKVIKQYFDTTKPYKCLEIASGTGAHVAHFAKELPNIDFQPSEHNPRALHSIVAYVDKYRYPNVRVPLFIDATKTPDLWALPEDYSPESVDLILNINMIHISSNSAIDGLFKAAEGLLKRGTGLLITYGPYAFDGKISPESNVNFHNGLISQNPEWGLRDVKELKELGKRNGLLLEKIHEMPANNHCLVFRRND